MLPMSFCAPSSHCWLNWRLEIPCVSCLLLSSYSFKDQHAQSVRFYTSVPKLNRWWLFCEIWHFTTLFALSWPKPIKTFDLLNASCVHLRLSNASSQIVTHILRLGIPLIHLCNKIANFQWCMLMGLSFKFIGLTELPCMQWLPSWVCPPRLTASKGILLHLILESLSHLPSLFHPFQCMI